MQSIQETLQGLNFGKNDIKVYLTLIKKGRQTVIDIATNSGVHRVNVYDALRVLETQGLVIKTEVANKSYFEAANPENLSLLVKRKEEEVTSIIPQLKQFYEQQENQSQTFEGLDGIKLILNDMLEVGKDIHAFGIPKEMPQLMKKFLNLFHEKRIVKNIKIDHIYNENAKERIKYLNKIKGSRAKYLPPEFSVPATTVIYGNKVAFWIWSETPFCVLITSEKMANAYLKYFELLWSMAK